MKIKKLIEKLSEFDENLEVVVHAYEGGCDPIGSFELSLIIKDNIKTDHFIYGAYSFIEKDEKSKYKKVSVLFLSY